jgi:hypothetical protein
VFDCIFGVSGANIVAPRQSLIGGANLSEQSATELNRELIRRFYEMWNRLDKPLVPALLTENMGIQAAHLDKAKMDTSNSANLWIHPADLSRLHQRD